MHMNDVATRFNPSLSTFTLMSFHDDDEDDWDDYDDENEDEDDEEDYGQIELDGFVVSDDGDGDFDSSGRAPDVNPYGEPDD